MKITKDKSHEGARVEPDALEPRQELPPDVRVQGEAQRTAPPTDVTDANKSDPQHADKVTASKDVPPSATMGNVTKERLGKQISFLGGVRPPRPNDE